MFYNYSVIVLGKKIACQKSILPISFKDVNYLWEYVHDSTLSESVCRDGLSNLHEFNLDEFNQKLTADGFQINESKCKEIRISFAPSTQEFQPITIIMSNL